MTSRVINCINNNNGWMHVIMLSHSVLQQVLTSS